MLVGSSMGGWIALLLARGAAGPVAGLVGIAAAPDFTEDSMWAQATAPQRAALLRDGQIERPSDYADAPYIITRRLIEEGRRHLVLREPLILPFPVRLAAGHGGYRRAAIGRAAPAGPRHRPGHPPDAGQGRRPPLLDA